MLNLKSIADDVLLVETKNLVQKEREILGLVLHHLREIDRRRLFSKHKFGSLYEFATQELGYSEDQAYRRIQAMKLLKELPEIEESIHNGSLNLTHLGMAQSLFKKEKKVGLKTYSKQEKLEILERFENTSKREAEKITVSISGGPIGPAEKIRFVSEEDVEIKFRAKEELLHKIQKLKSLYAHKNPNLQLSELIEELCDFALEKLDKISAPARKNNSKKGDNQGQSYQKQKMSQAEIKRVVWRRARGQCQICSSNYALEIDHILPKALGGGDTLENLRLLCRSCNQREAINVFGISKMEKYIST